DLYRAANLTIDPCRSFFDHTCYALVNATDDRHERVNLTTDAVDGSSKTEAGAAIVAYYHACVLSPEDATYVARASADAIARASDIAKNASVNSHGLLTLLVDLSITYGLPSIIEFSIGAGSNHAPYLNISPSWLVQKSENLSSDVLDGLKKDALVAVNEAVSYNVSIIDMNRFMNETMKPMAEATEKYEFDSVTKLAPNVTTEQWKELMSKFNVTVHDVFSVPKPALEDIFTGVFGPEKRQVAIVSALVEASLKLASRLILDTNNTDAKKLTCQIKAKQLRPLWILDSIQLLKSDTQDAAINRAYTIVADAVLQKVRSGMAADDFQKLSETIKKMRLLLPSNIVPGDLTIPNMTAVYAHAELVTRAYLLRARRHWTFTLAASEDLLEDFQKRYVVINDNVLTVPTSVYGLVSLTDNAEPMVLMSTVGIYLADSLWQFIFSSMWSTATNATLEAYRECIVENSLALIEWHSRLLWLSVQTSMEAGKEVDWDSVVDTNVPLSVTRRQLFYMIFVHYSMCRSPHRSYPTFRHDVDVLMSGFKNFSDSFHCNVTVSKTTGDVCSL
ncbi:hypothetical protein V5799_010526, partial [Amblyomma americanum]